MIENLIFSEMANAAANAGTGPAFSFKDKANWGRRKYGGFDLKHPYTNPLSSECNCLEAFSAAVKGWPAQ